MSKTTHYELNTPIGSEVLSVMTGLNPNFNTIDGTMYDNEVRSTQALNKANVNEQNIATALGRITTAEGDIDTLESGLETANTNISGLTSRVGTAEANIVSANNRIQENTNNIASVDTKADSKIKGLAWSQKTKITSGDFPYTLPKDGAIYVDIYSNPNTTAILRFQDTNNITYSTSCYNSEFSNMFFLEGGDTLTITASANLNKYDIYFVPYKY